MRTSFRGGDVLNQQELFLGTLVGLVYLGSLFSYSWLWAPSFFGIMRGSTA